MKNSMNLTAQNVTSVFMDCLFTDAEAEILDVDSGNYLKGIGVGLYIGFNIERTTGHKENVRSMLNCLSDSFKESGGGGNSFLNICEDAQGNLWTDSHQVVNQLVCLAVALGLGALIATEFQEALPGGMPYFVVKDTSIE